MSVHGKGKQMVSFEIGELDSVVGNPPYVRQEALSTRISVLKVASEPSGAIRHLYLCGFERDHNV
jgi:methylase of polypeptide subunit release factors